MIMSRNIKGGFLTLSSVVGIVGMIIAAMQNPATAWVTPLNVRSEEHTSELQSH